MRTLVLTMLAIAAMAGNARADERHQAVTTQPLAVVGRGASLGYERIAANRWSVVALLGLRATAMGDYSSTTLSAGGELRFWPRARPGHELRGVYVALHATAGRTHLTDETMDTSVGTTVELTERLDIGWRFVVRHRFAMSPTLGLGGHQDIDTSRRLATVNAPAIMIGFEVGWLF